MNVNIADELGDGVESVGIRLLPSLATAGLAGLDAWKKDNTLKGDDKSSLIRSGLESGCGHFQLRPLVEKRNKLSHETQKFISLFVRPFYTVCSTYTLTCLKKNKA